MAHKTAQPESDATPMTRAERFMHDEQVLQRFEKLLDDRDEVGALECLALAVHQDSHPDLDDAFATCLTQYSDTDNAYALLQRCTEKNTQSAPLCVALGELAVALDKPADALLAFERAEALGAASAEMYQLWAASVIALGDPKGAEVLFETALELEPDAVSDTYSAWGKALCDAGHTRAAKDKLKVAIAADARAFYPHAYLGVAHLQDANNETDDGKRRPFEEQAIVAFRRALELLPVGHDAYASWIVLELSTAIERVEGAAATLQLLNEQLRKGRYSPQLFEKLNKLRMAPLAPKARHIILIIAGEDGSGDFYLEAEVNADDEDKALALVKDLFPSAEADSLVVADVKIGGRPTLPYAGVTELSDKTRVPSADAELAAAAADDSLREDPEDQAPVQQSRSRKALPARAEPPRPDANDDDDSEDEDEPKDDEGEP